MGEEICRGKKANWIVVSVEAKDDYTLIVEFIDGKKKIIDMKPLLEKEVFIPLKDKELFMKAKVEGDSVCWNEEIDIAPEYLYENGTEE